MPVTDGLSDEELRVEKKIDSFDGDAVHLSVDTVAEIDSVDGIGHNGMELEARVFKETVDNPVATSSSMIPNLEAMIVADSISKGMEMIDMQLKQSRHEDSEGQNSSSRFLKHAITNPVYRERVNVEDKKIAFVRSYTDMCNVSINGNPISPLEVEKAEMLAGTIQPGDYWYDSRAGFWGVLGQPCQGIIPPFIQEFEFPMPRNCGAGNTGICVNGRELHQKDLNLLASRGLPITSNKSYMIDISGKVIDQSSGKELDKLAPILERTRKGFGMKVPQGGTAARPSYFNDGVAETKSVDGIDHSDMELEARVFKETAVIAVASSSPRIQNSKAMVVTDRSNEREMINVQLKQSRHKDSEDGNRFRTDGPLRPKDTNYLREVDTDGRDGQYWNSRVVGEQGRFSSSSYTNEEQMRYQAAPRVNNYGTMTNQDRRDGFERVENLEHDRAELRRQLNELEDQLRRSSGVRDAPIELRSVDRRRVPSDHYGGYDAYMNPSSHSVLQGRTAARPPYSNDGPVHVPSVNRHDGGLGHIPLVNRQDRERTLMDIPNRLPGYNSPAHAPSVYRHEGGHGHVPLVNRQDRETRYVYSPPRNVPNSLSGHNSPARAPSVNRHDSGIGHVSSVNRQDRDMRYNSPAHAPPRNVPNSIPRYESSIRPEVHRRRPPPQLSSFQHQSVSFGNSTAGRYSDASQDPIDPYPRRVVMSLSKRRLCQPLAGGAPFITCHNCSELLKVPGKFMLMEKHKRKLRCGACATLISFEPDNEKLIVSKPTHDTEALTPRNDEIPNEVFNNNLKESSHPDSAYTVQSTDTEETNQQTNERRLNTNGPEIRQQQEQPDTIQATDTETYPQPNKQRLITNGSEIRQQEHHYSSSVSSEEKESVIAPPYNESTAAGPSVTTASSDGGYIRPHYVARRYGMGNMSNSMNQESDLRNNSMSGRNAAKDDVPKERNVSFKDHSGTSFDHDPAEVNRGDHLLKPKKAKRSFFVTIKKSFRNSDSSRSTTPGLDNMRLSNVSINGKPISPDDIERAEMLAGTIQPGDYW